ncbi:hypothetical protein [uncultured Lacinutrix sp.]|uniref:hypothetical protein n=1 Tax=uncultured Lacinutrix sp. TaxID=574032 RepID=UPI0026106312|nr:hypothetical protein [uncultured Lacinutrix sp.]
MVTIIHKKEIEQLIQDIDVVEAMEKGFVAYSNGNTIVPPVGELLFKEPKGETHIKYGYIKNDEYYVIKVASGFYDNPKLGIASSQGLMLLFSQKTGQPIAFLLDEGHLTDIRTAAAGALAAKYFAPKKIKAIGIIGTGIQAKLQLQYLQQHTPCKTVWVWGRNVKNIEKFKSNLDHDFNIQIAKNPAEVAAHSNLIVTTTPSETPLLSSKDILPGTHITAVGSDTSKKQELTSNLVAKAHILIVDSISQSKSRGEIYRAVKNGKLLPEKVLELGNAIQDISIQRTSEQQISIVDLTGVAVQDIMIAKAIYTNFKK